MQYSGDVPGTVGTIVFLEKSEPEFTCVGVLRGTTNYEKGKSPIVRKLTSEIEIVDVAHAEHVPKNENSSDFFPVTMRASVAITAMKECIVNFDDIVNTDDTDD